MTRRIQVAMDCADPGLLARFWAEVLGYRDAKPPDGHPTWAEFSQAEANSPDEQWHVLVDPDGGGPSVLFHRVPEPKSAKNRVHLDVWVEQHEAGTDRRPLVEAEVLRLVALGGRQVRVADKDGDFYIVMADPEGNEFCVA